MSKAHPSDFRVSRPFGNLVSPFAKRRPAMETSFRPQRAQCILTRPLELSETKLIGEVVGSLPLGIIHLKTTTFSECKTLKVRWLLTFFGITLMQGERVEHDYNS
jgi:hypothetical protein